MKKLFLSVILMMSPVIAHATGQIIINGAGGGTTLPALSGHNYCPPEFGGCYMNPSQSVVQTSATVTCEGFWGGVPGSSSIAVSSASVYYNGTGGAQMAVGFYNSSSNLIAQTTATVSGTGITLLFGSPVVLTAGSYYYLCWAADSAAQFFASAQDGYSPYLNDLGQAASNYSIFTAANASTVGSGPVVILPSSLGTRTSPSAATFVSIAVTLK